MTLNSNFRAQQMVGNITNRELILYILQKIILQKIIFQKKIIFTKDHFKNTFHDLNMSSIPSICEQK